MEREVSVFLQEGTFVQRGPQRVAPAAAREAEAQAGAWAGGREPLARSGSGAARDAGEPAREGDGGADGGASAAPRPPTVMIEPRATAEDCLFRLQGELAEKQAQEESWKAQFLAMQSKADSLERQTSEIRSGMEALIGAVERKDRELEIAMEEIRRLSGAQTSPVVALDARTAPQAVRRWSSVPVPSREAKASASASALSPVLSSQTSAREVVPPRSPILDGLRSPAVDGAATPLRPPLFAQDEAARRTGSPPPCSTTSASPPAAQGAPCVVYRSREPSPRGGAAGGRVVATVTRSREPSPRGGTAGGRVVATVTRSASASAGPSRVAGHRPSAPQATVRVVQKALQRPAAAQGAAAGGQPARGRRPSAAQPAPRSSRGQPAGVRPAAARQPAPAAPSAARAAPQAAASPPAASGTPAGAGARGGRLRAATILGGAPLQAAPSGPAARCPAAAASTAPALPATTAAVASTAPAPPAAAPARPASPAVASTALAPPTTTQAQLVPAPAAEAASPAAEAACQQPPSQWSLPCCGHKHPPRGSPDSAASAASQPAQSRGSCDSAASAEPQPAQPPPPRLPQKEQQAADALAPGAPAPPPASAVPTASPAAAPGQAPAVQPRQPLAAAPAATAPAVLVRRASGTSPSPRGVSPPPRAATPPAAALARAGGAKAAFPLWAPVVAVQAGTPPAPAQQLAPAVRRVVELQVGTRWPLSARATSPRQPAAAPDAPPSAKQAATPPAPAQQLAPAVHRVAAPQVVLLRAPPTLLQAARVAAPHADGQAPPRFSWPQTPTEVERPQAHRRAAATE